MATEEESSIKEVSFLDELGNKQIILPANDLTGPAMQRIWERNARETMWKKQAADAEYCRQHPEYLEERDRSMAALSQYSVDLDAENQEKLAFAEKEKERVRLDEEQERARLMTNDHEHLLMLLSKNYPHTKWDDGAKHSLASTHVQGREQQQQQNGIVSHDRQIPPQVLIQPPLQLSIKLTSQVPGQEPLQASNQVPAGIPYQASHKTPRQVLTQVPLAMPVGVVHQAPYRQSCHTSSQTPAEPPNQAPYQAPYQAPRQAPRQLACRTSAQVPVEASLVVSYPTLYQQEHKAATSILAEMSYQAPRQAPTQAALGVPMGSPPMVPYPSSLQARHQIPCSLDHPSSVYLSRRAPTEQQVASMPGTQDAHIQPRSVFQPKRSAQAMTEPYPETKRQMIKDPRQQYAPLPQQHVLPATMPHYYTNRTSNAPRCYTNLPPSSQSSAISSLQNAALWRPDMDGINSLGGINPCPSVGMFTCVGPPQTSDYFSQPLDQNRVQGPRLQYPAIICGQIFDPDATLLPGQGRGTKPLPPPQANHPPIL